MELLQNVLDHIPALISLQDPEGELLYVNREFERVVGWTLEEARRHPDFLSELYPDPADRREVARFTHAATREWQDFRTRVRDGRILDTRWAVVRLSDGSTLGIGQDLTVRKRLEERFYEAQRLESLGRLAGGVAHDFNNLLTAMLGYSELLRLRLAADPDALADLDQVRLAGARARDLTGQLLAVARRQVIASRPVDPNSLTRETVSLLRRVLGEDITIETAYQPDPWTVHVDPAQFQQVIMNLAINARDAMPQGGTFRLETANVTLRRAAAAERQLSPGDYLELVVRDSGHGMSRETLQRAFEPFFTTKPHGQGTGLGLAIAYGVVRQSGGQILAESEPGQGTTFRIWLPRAVGPTGAAAASASAVGPGGAETLLLVEDDRAVRDLLARTLSDAGYRVLAAAEGPRALELSAAEPGAIHLLVSDVVMPTLSGRQIADRLGRERPGLRVLFISGYAEDTMLQHGVVEAGVAFLAKPFTPAQLLESVRALLDAPGPP